MRAVAVLLCWLASASSSGCGHTNAAERALPPSASSPPLFINLTHGKSDLHAASMGLALAKSALDSGSRVVVLLNVEAAAFADRALGADVRFADFPPVAELLGSIIAKGGQVLVCGHCAAVLKVAKENLAPGISISEHSGILAALQPGTVVFSY